MEIVPMEIVPMEIVSRELTFNFPKLIINFNNKQIIALPVNAFKIIDLFDRIIVLYKFTYYDYLSREYIESTIPYYLSDGQTNNFRANMLFPFICINDPDNLKSGCAVNDIEPRGLVYKYHAIQNLNLNIVRDWINSEIIKEFGKDKGSNFINIILEESSKSKGVSHRIGVSSVLPRIENLLDFF